MKNTISPVVTMNNVIDREFLRAEIMSVMKEINSNTVKVGQVIPESKLKRKKVDDLTGRLF